MADGFLRGEKLFIRFLLTSRAFDYYLRGRVDYNGKGKPVVYMSPHVDEKFVEEIEEAFQLTEKPLIRYDGSEHYKCYLDRK